jgi:putative nucleotidyltransferase with HDIG domain
MDRFIQEILNALGREFSSNPLLRALDDFAKAQPSPVYLVGGLLRDLALGHSSVNFGPDADCVVPCAEESARAFAGQIDGSLIRLDPANWRVIPNGQGLAGPYAGWVDFADLRGEDIQTDLAERDFTLNALACRLPNPSDLLDPENGIEDLRARRIRAVSGKAFQEDPVRLLRAYRLAAQLDLSIEPETLSLMKRDAADVKGESGERLRAEMFGMLAEPCGARKFREMQGSGVLSVLFPECKQMEGIEQGGYHHADVLTHSLETVEALEDIVNDPPGEPLRKTIREYQDPPHRLPVLKLAALLHDMGKPKTRAETEAPPDGPSLSDKPFTFHGHEKVGAEKAVEIARRFRLSRRERESLVRLVSLHMRPGYLFWESGGDPKGLSGRALHRLAREAGDDLPGVALLAMADAFSRKGPLADAEDAGRVVQFAQGVLAELECRVFPVLRGPRLVTGRDLMEALGLGEGPLIGELLLAVEEAHAAGEIKTKPEALKFAEERVKAGSGEASSRGSGPPSPH